MYPSRTITKNFEDLIAWQKGQDLAVQIYEYFSSSKDFGFRDQICRAAVSVSNNIAEGFDRHSNKEMARFLYISRASSSEVKSMLYLAEKLNMVDSMTANKLRNYCTEVSKIVNGLLKTL
jgi:four helix bundle protein